MLRAAKPVERADLGPRAAVAVLLFVHGVVRLRRRGRADLADWKRVVLFGAGSASRSSRSSGRSTVSPTSQLLWAHMLQHVLIGDLGRR